jgi:flagellar biogenesis protein FliO
MMDKEDGKYDKVLELLKGAKPVLNQTYEIEENVLRRIQETNRNKADFSDLLESLFGWTESKWLRRTMVMASLFIVIVFVFQQSILLSKITRLSRKIESGEQQVSTINDGELSRRILLFRVSEKRFPIGQKDLSEKKIEELMKSIDRLNREYRDLRNVIMEDPELKKLIEKRLSEINGDNINL